MRQIVCMRMAESLIATPHMRCLVPWQAWHPWHQPKRPSHFRTRETSCSCRRRSRRTDTWRMAARERSSRPRRELSQEVYRPGPFAPPLLVQLPLQPHRLQVCWCSTGPVSRVEAQHCLALAPKRGWHCSLVWYWPPLLVALSILLLRNHGDSSSGYEWPQQSGLQAASQSYSTCSRICYDRSQLCPLLLLSIVFA